MMNWRYANTTWIKNEYFLHPYTQAIHDYFVSMIQILYAYSQ